MKNEVVSLEVSTYRGDLGISVNGSIKVVTRGRVGKIDVMQDKTQLIGILPKHLQVKLAHAVQEIEDYYNDVEEVASGEATLGRSVKKNMIKKKPELPEQPEDEFIELDPEDYLQD